MGLNAFDHIVSSLGNIELTTRLLDPKISVQVPVKPDSMRISKDEFELFLKDFVFEKLKGKSLSKAFLERYPVKDIMFRISISDDMAMDYIKKYYIT